MSDRSATTIMTTFSHPRDFTPCLRSSCNSGTCTRAALCACGSAIVRKRGRSWRGKNKWKGCQGQLHLSPQEQDGHPVISMRKLWLVRWCPTPQSGPLFGVYRLDPQLLLKPFPLIAKGLLKKTFKKCIKLHLPAVGPLNLGAIWSLNVKID